MHMPDFFLISMIDGQKYVSERPANNYIYIISAKEQSCNEKILQKRYGGFVHKKHGLYSHFVIIYTRRKIESGVCRIRKVVSIS